jgi:hypothetical protein
MRAQVIQKRPEQAEVGEKAAEIDHADQPVPEAPGVAAEEQGEDIKDDARDRRQDSPGQEAILFRETLPDGRVPVCKLGQDCQKRAPELQRDLQRCERRQIFQQAHIDSPYVSTDGAVGRFCVVPASAYPAYGSSILVTAQTRLFRSIE